MNTYGYVRVSSREQNEDRQLIALKEIGLTGGNDFSGQTIRQGF